MFKYRVPDEIIRKLNRMKPPSYELTSTDANIRFIQDTAFESGYKQAVKEMKEYFGIKGNGIHAK